MNFVDILHSDRYTYMIFTVDFFLVVLMLSIVGRITGIVASVNSVKELSHRDNHAFGISYAGAILALGIMMTGVLSGDETITLQYEASIVIAYGFMGIFLMALSRYFFDKISLPLIDIHKEIINGNKCAAIIDAANVIATALIVRAVMIWVDTEAFSGLIVVVAGFVLSQLIMISVTRYRLFVYARRHNGKNLQKAFEAGNFAIALRYFGHKIGVALAVTAASGMVYYVEGDEFKSVLVWAVVSFILTGVLSALSIAARHVILYGINVVEEVDIQSNTGIGLIEATIFIVNGVILITLLGLPANL